MAVQTLLIGPGYGLAQVAAREFPPLALVLLRFIASAALLVPVFYLRGGWRTFRPTRRQWGLITLMAVAGLALNQALFLVGLRYTTPAHSALLYGLTPVFVLLLAALVFRVERLTALKLGAISVALFGLVMVLLGRGLTLQTEHLAGDLITLVAVLGWSFYIAMGRIATPGFDSLQLTAVVLVISTAAFMPIGSVALAHMPWAGPSAYGWVAFAYIVLVNSTFSVWAFLYSVRRTSASLVATYTMLQPISAALAAVLFFSEALSAWFLVGGTVAMAGVGWLHWLNRPARAQPAPAAVAAETAIP